ncbi:hypothetical protein ACHHYP_20003 [Achlya hypogyna]|uniref:Uncharacterized protein n=1 Tax=Achlya hypogyna TaxID=1202772 RepID=A0A1V9ZC98_ACHHY|nr:hypothetical protein ACHHYP_20003 [Achlya hypogyna]
MRQPLSRLPLANAVLSNNMAVLQYLGERGCSGAFTAAEEAAAAGHLDMLQYIFETLEHPKRPLDIDRVARNGHLHVLQYLAASHHNTVAHGAMKESAAKGHLAIVEFLAATGMCSNSEGALDAAATQGHLAVLHDASHGRRRHQWTRGRRRLPAR